MSRLDCISNRNIKIIANYVNSKLGTYQSLLDGLPFPSEEYPSPEDFFLNEDEWTSFANFCQIFQRAKELVGEPYFSFNCGASSVRLGSLGRFHYFVKIFATPNDGFERLPFFNKNFNDTKDIEIIMPPTYDGNLKRFRTLFKVAFHSDMDPHLDYMGDAYLRGLVSVIPTFWGLAPALIKQPLNPYNPEVLFNQNAEFTTYGLNVKIDQDRLTLQDPNSGRRCQVGKKVLLLPQVVNGQEVFTGKYIPYDPGLPTHKEGTRAILITRTIRYGDRILLKAGEIFMAPYFLLDVSYERLSPWRRLGQLYPVRGTRRDSGTELADTINQLRKSMRAKNDAYQALEKTNAQLRQAKAMLHEYNQKLEQKVKARTEALAKAQAELVQMNRDLEAKVAQQLNQLNKYNELRRYLSPKLTEKILTSGHPLGNESQRKTMTVVFTDIRGFSGLTDSLEPEEIFTLLDRYLNQMIAIIHAHDGTLNKIIGDGLLIFFGDPLPMVDHAQRAVRMAVDMQRKVADLKAEWRQYGHELGIGIGINTGYMTVGNVGSNIHRDYTVIGNQVNVAARLESLAGADQILLSQRTYCRVKELVEVAEMGEIKVKGVHHPIHIYNVLW